MGKNRFLEQIQRRPFIPFYTKIVHWKADKSTKLACVNEEKDTDVQNFSQNLELVLSKTNKRKT